MSEREADIDINAAGSGITGVLLDQTFTLLQFDYGLTPTPDTFIKSRDEYARAFTRNGHLIGKTSEEVKQVRSGQAWFSDEDVPAGEIHVVFPTRTAIIRNFIT